MGSGAGSFLKVLLKNFDVLAGPVVSLVYPLYASVRAIKTKSPIDDQQWFTYWVLYSMIMLFELTLAKLLEWIPFWPYAKLLLTCWLVFPYFSGAAYVYNHYMRPFFVNRQTVNILYFPRKKDKPYDILNPAKAWAKAKAWAAKAKACAAKAKAWLPRHATAKAWAAKAKACVAKAKACAAKATPRHAKAKAWAAKAKACAAKAKAWAAKAKACAAKAKAWVAKAKACAAKAKAWVAKAKACAAKAMSWLPRHATAKAWAAKAKACAAKAMPWLPRHATAKA